ncbi:MAG TPA: TonB-dependent receptor [Vicinamibacterales bacterium]
MQVCTLGRACAVLVASLALGAQAMAQSGLVLSGRLVNSLTGEPVAGAVVLLEELRRDTTSDGNGLFSFENVPPGSYHLSVHFEGFSSRRTEVDVTADGASVELVVEPDLHFQEVVSVGPARRSQFEAYQPTTVLDGQELTKQLEPSLGETLQYQPGVTTRSLGPSPARPVIRGLDGDRILILQDGQRTGDLSSQSGDHGVAVNPAAAQRIEVVRGPATLLYGANAIGGLVNVITDEIPTSPERGAGGNIVLDLGSAAAQAGAAGDVHVGNGSLALHVGGGGRRSGDVGTPLGDVENSQSRSGFGTVGLAWTRENGYFGGSYGYDDTRFGIPVIEEGRLQMTPRRHAFTLRSGGQNLGGALQAFRATLAHRRYRHDELVGSEIGTQFRNDTTEIEVMGSHRALGRLQGSVGGWFLDRAFDAIGEEALSPAVDQRGFAAFLYEELTWPHVTVQFGARVDHTRFGPAGEPSRTFTTGSFSTGVAWRPAAARDAVTLAASLARAARNPALEELFFFGPHHGNFAFEVGNPDLASEKALGFDLSLRWRTGRFSGEVTYFRNDISDYIFRRPITEGEFEAREEEFEGRFPGRILSHEHHGHGGEEADLLFIEYVGADSVLQGIEGHADVVLTSQLVAEAGIDYVRGTLKADDSPLPRIPPLRVRGGLRYQRNAFQAGGEVIRAAEQDRLAAAETRTDGYTLLKLFAAYSFQTGGAVSTVTARLDNATNELYRNHLSLIKDLVPEMGRNFKLLYSVKF